MEHKHIPLPPLATPGVVTTFYTYEGGAARNAMLAALALHLAGQRAGADGAPCVASGAAVGSTPVLVIDWDTDAPALHRHFDLAPDDGVHDTGESASARPGLVEFFQTCQELLRPGALARAAGHGAATPGVARPGVATPGVATPAAGWSADPAPRAAAAASGDEARAERVLDAIDWGACIERADQRRPLYLMRAGRFDEGYAERAGRLDWEALFDACPALFRRFGARMARHFGHVLVASRGGRSPAVSVCSTLLADRLVGLFTPAPGSLEGFEGVVRRAIDYRCTHEDEQRPLLAYPLACAPDGARSDPYARWRRGDARSSMPGYQPRLEILMRSCYGWPRVNLDSYFDELQLSLADAVSTAGPGADRRALARFAAALAEWVGPGHFPWQSLDEIRLRAAVARARVLEPGASARELADALAALGTLCRREGRPDEARDCLEESLALRERMLDDEHPAVRAARAALASLLHHSGALHEARRQYELLGATCARGLGADHPETLAARSRLARVLAGLGEAERALALHEQVVAACERALGEDHPATLGSLEDLATTLVD
ncbi:tetratricopeptide repeat protein [Massilia sp. KIM]|uniref:tetratricopeptide repeat protein n=1 Tax=Massilia sp. KIM TaxID=1955422 RepID=UPI001E632A30|nr:tetratricopeptide repeat protein [Massilia sp. KIM]